jgi:glycosyltransferase involved in cell wall biosynthesis
VSDRLTILHLSHERHGGGSTLSVALLARAQREAGHAVAIGCAEGSELAEQAAATGLEVTPVDFTRTGPAAARVAQLAARGVDVINAHGSRDRAACRRARLLGRLPASLVVTRRSMPRSTPVSALLDGVLADRVIAVSRAVALALVRRLTPPWRVAVVPNAVDLSRLDGPVSDAELAEARAAAGCEDGRPTVGVVARRKDQATLLAALRHLPRPITLCCLGIEPDEELTRLAGAVPGHRVTFVPFRREVRAFYSVFDAVVLPTRGEGCSQALLEAMALGKPVVTARAGGNAEVADHGAHALLVAPGDARGYAAALETVLADPGLAARLGASATRRARTQFSIERTLAGTLAAYRVALARRER